MTHMKTPLLYRLSSAVGQKAFLAAAIIVSLLSATAAPPDPAVGNWKGTLNAGGVKLRLAFKISQSSSGELIAKMDSLDQGARDIPVDSAVKKANSLRLEVNSIQGVYEGTLDKSGSHITGTWTQG